MIQRQYQLSTQMQQGQKDESWYFGAKTPKVKIKEPVSRMSAALHTGVYSYTRR